MHNFICRTFFYTLTFMFLNTAFGSWPDFNTATPYFIHYGYLLISAIAALEAVFQLARYFKLKYSIENAETAKLQVPETKRFDTKP